MTDSGALERQERDFQDPALHEFKEVFLGVIGPQIEFEKRSLAPRQDSQAFFARRLPVYADALRRGQPVVMEQLSRGPLRQDLPIGSAQRLITLMPDMKLSWQIGPISEDPFARDDFNKAVEDEDAEVAGELEIWQDPYVVGLMVENGRGQQRRIYQRWLGVYQGVVNAETARGPLGQYQFMKYFHKRIGFRDESEGTSSWRMTDTLGFEDVKALGIGLKSIPAREHQEVFIEQSVVSGRISLKALDQADTAVKSLEGLERLFLRFNADKLAFEPVRYNERVRSEDTFLVELLTNPDFLDYPEAYSTPQTLRAHVGVFYRFLESINSQYEGNERKVLVYRLVREVISHHRDKLDSMLQGQNIDPETGNQYLRSMLASRLNHHLEDRTYQKGMDRAVFVFGYPHLPRRPEESEEAEKAASARDFVTTFLEHGSFRVDWQRLFQQSARYTSYILDALVNYPENGPLHPRKEVGIYYLLRRFGVGFNARAKKLDLDKPEDWNVFNIDTFNHFRGELLGRLAGQLESGTDSYTIVSAVGYMVGQATYREYVENVLGLRLNPTGTINERSLNARLKDSSDPDLFPAQSLALLVISDHYKSILDSNLDKLAADRIGKYLSTDIKAGGDSAIAERVRSMASGSSELESLRSLVVALAQETMGTIWRSNFGLQSERERIDTLRRILLEAPDTSRES